MGLLGPASWSSGSFGLAWFHFGRTSGRRVHSGSRGFPPARFEVVGIILVRLGPLLRYSVSLVFTLVQSGPTRC